MVVMIHIGSNGLYFAPLAYDETEKENYYQVRSHANIALVRRIVSYEVCRSTEVYLFHRHPIIAVLCREIREKHLHLVVNLRKGVYREYHEIQNERYESLNEIVEETAKIETENH